MKTNLAEKYSVYIIYLFFSLLIILFTHLYKQPTESLDRML